MPVTVLSRPTYCSRSMDPLAISDILGQIHGGNTLSWYSDGWASNRFQDDIDFNARLDSIVYDQSFSRLHT